MGKREVRRYLIQYHALGPMLWVGSVFLVLLWLSSLFLNQPLAYKMRALGVICFSVAAAVGLLRTLLVLVKTANLNQD